MKATVKKWGNSAAIRIPAALMEAAQLEIEAAVDIREEEGLIVIEPVARKSYVLEDLLKNINSGNLHEPIDFGPAVGKEIW